MFVVEGGKNVGAVKKLLLYFWNLFVNTKTKLRQKRLLRADKRYVRKHPAPHVLSIEETLDRIITEKLSVARFGDGEIKLAAGRNISFQNLNSDLSAKLGAVLQSRDDGFLVCVPDVFGDRSYLLPQHAAHWERHLSEFRRSWYGFLHPEQTYGNAFLSRCYIILRDKSRSGQYFEKLKQIWDGADILLIEGEKSRLGIGNDLFDNARSVQRILGPVRDAYEKYDALLQAAREYGKDKLILLALGPTASVLSYALFREGFRAVDLGHADIEYEWFLSGATERVPVKNKFVNEAGAGRGVGELEDAAYQSQILKKIL